MSEPRRQPVRNLSVLRRELPDVLRKLGVEGDPHRKAARYCSSVKPATRPVAMSSMRRMPCFTASFSGAGSTTLSTRRRASSRRSSGGSSSAARDRSAVSMGKDYFADRAMQAGVGVTATPSSLVLYLKNSGNEKTGDGGVASTRLRRGVAATPTASPTHGKTAG